MSEWRGLHDPTQPCPDCGICRDGRWCRCCLEAQVQRVREACEPFGPMGSIAVWRVLRALDGAE